MKPTSKIATWSVLAALATASVSPALADGYQSRADQQNSKNTMRNLGIVGAAVAAFGLLNHNNTLTLLGAAGAALAGNQYEKDRQQQSQDNNGYYYRDGRNQNNGWNRYDSRNENNRDGNQRRGSQPDRFDHHR